MNMYCAVASSIAMTSMDFKLDIERGVLYIEKDSGRMQKIT